ncbi:hypothetical protein H5P28_12315 [Ruficoccus amylovorans]|uniref:Methyltransferase domain-containing protein n=1 Tax=Ruficoccus amylovorans TaxID=1804625 RepID=A0A842HEU3_9BACT|nr:methyltransferase domain-containing protein [Ruficoccus amylovorans]MBC2595043.1 hypothetical protein [Ruficoccus amylovorans]
MIKREERQNFPEDSAVSADAENTYAAVTGLQRRITHESLDHVAFAELGEAWQQAGHLGEAIVAFERALQLKEYSVQRKLSDGAARLMDLEAAARTPGQVLTLGGYAFPRLLIHHTGGLILEGRSADGQALLKLYLNPEGRETVTREARTLKILNRAEVLAAPRLLAVGEVSGTQLPDTLDEACRAILRTAGTEKFSFLIHSFQKQDAGWNFADVALAMLELRACGIINPGLTAADIRYDAEAGVCGFAGFAGAQQAPEQLRSLPAREFFRELARQASECSQESFSATLQGIEQDGRWAEYFAADALDLFRTHAFVPQWTTGCPRRVYHTVTERDVAITGGRELSVERRALLEQIAFEPDESVLDAGCAGGQISVWLARRGCRVVAADVDRRLMHGCQMVANITGLDVTYLEVDFDYDEVPGAFRTTFALGLLPHLRRREEACAKLAAATTHRLIVEAALAEDGYKWVNQGFVKLEPWAFPDTEALVDELERLFPGFTHERTLGMCDEDRYLLEFKRKSTKEGDGC